jgi:aspartyl-tRNA(Asn)/glutamyl-tRNA(Gln) amidotransferase subunit C
MIIDDKLLEKIAKLAKLEFDGEEKEKIKGDLNKMLAFVEKLNELDTEGVEPLKYVNEEEIAFLRPDKPEQTITQEEALKNAPDHDSDYFKVPKVIKGK